MRLSVLALASLSVLAACGRTGLPGAVLPPETLGDSDGDPDSGTPDDDVVDVKEPDLLQLFASRTEHLVAYYHFEGDFTDASPHGNTLAVRDGSPGFETVTPAVGSQSAKLFDDSLQLANRPEVAVTALSYSLWFISDLLPDANANTMHTLLKISQGGNDYNPVFSAGVCNYAYQDDSTCYGGNLRVNDQVETDTHATPNAWHHLAGSVGAQGSHHYLDGVLVIDDGTAVAPFANDNSYLTLGVLWPNVDPLYNPMFIHGALDEVAIWNTELTAEELSAIYRNQKP